MKKSLLDHLGARPGEKILVAPRPDGSVELRGPPTGNISDTFGRLAKPGQHPVSLEEMNEVIARGWAGLL